MAKLAQCAGRAARDSNSLGLFLMMVEPWVLNLQLDVTNRPTDPDQPYAESLKKNPSKQEHTSIASLEYGRLETCLREVFATYLGDKSLEALRFTGLWCCDRHKATSFDIATFFHSKPSDSTMSYDSSEQRPPTKRKRNQMRRINE
ncbi:hypothetical protein J3R83DRAFT_10963 [Lanmaoa asiatica]|nr:hypothetical protein J3R83DRAFT_10963 [Lanmaoa asiatica]